MVTISEIWINEFFRSAIILGFSLIFATVEDFILKNYIKRLTKKTKSDIDDIVLAIVTKPIYYFIIFTGFYSAFKNLSSLSQYVFYADKVYFVGTVLILALLLSRILSFFISRWLQVSKQFEKTPQLLNKIVKVTIYVMAFMIILSHFEINITPILTTLGVASLAVGLALQNTLTNFFAGLHLISDKPIKVGDFIETDSKVSGHIDDIGWRSTRIKTLTDTIVIIPNNKLAESTITNTSIPKEGIYMRVECGVGYSSDLKKVEKVTLDVAKKIIATVPGCVKKAEPSMRYNAFADSNINFGVSILIDNFEDMYLIRHEFIKALKERYDKEGIEISWPVRKIYNAK
jgi:small-conductance mechanosensitive channel